jgi:hypothetical protein
MIDMSEKNELPGIAFEKLVAAMQAQLDQNSVVTHNEIIVDRLGHRRQFDVVIRGKFAGQTMLGVIECKDLSRKVGNPEVDAFVTKARDVNANVKILMSKSGFAKPALEKCRDYGIQALSLVKSDPVNKNFFLGTRVTADVARWNQLSLSLHVADGEDGNLALNPFDVSIRGKRIVDWFTNYLLEQDTKVQGTGWVVGLRVDFAKPQVVEARAGVERLCTGVTFGAERIIEQLEYRVGITGEGFFDWNAKQATFLPGSMIMTRGIPAGDFSQWKPRSDGTWKGSNFFELHMEAIRLMFSPVEDAIDLEAL